MKNNLYLCFESNNSKKILEIFAFAYENNKMMRTQNLGAISVIKRARITTKSDHFSWNTSTGKWG